MALQIGGQISLSNITGEMGIVNSNVSLGGLSTHSTLNDQSPYKPNESQPHAMSEFFAYDHSYSSLKAMSGGPARSQIEGKWFDFCSDDAKFFYAHDGSGDLPAINDQVYGNDRGSYYTLGQGLLKVVHPEDPTISFIIQTNSSGTVIDINSCEGVGGDPKDPGLEPDEDPFRR